MVYQWKVNYRSSIPAPVVGEVCESIRDKTGSLTAEHLVSAATPAASPIHELFEWNDSDAAHRYRLAQARQVLAHLVVKETAHAAPRRAYISVNHPESGRSYEHTSTVLSVASLRDQLLLSAIKELQSWRDKYADLGELEPMLDVIDEYMEAVQEVNA